VFTQAVYMPLSLADIGSYVQLSAALHHPLTRL